jgi:hypothetical protein
MRDEPQFVRQIGRYTVKVIQRCIAAASCVAISLTYLNQRSQFGEIIENGKMKKTISCWPPSRVQLSD